MSDAEQIVEQFRTIDSIRSVSDMKKAVSLLPEPRRTHVVGHALMYSRFQFTWSWLAKEFGVNVDAYPEVIRDWP